MRYWQAVRAIAGSAGLAGCVLLLATQARAQSLAAATSEIIVQSRAPVIAPEIFGTATLDVRAERYLDDWERARRDASAFPMMQALIAPARGLNRAQQINYVQAAVHRQIHWISDATEWGQHDYWASAEETLRHGAGDMEDRAIVKMQALRALGFLSRDLYLTLGRDKVGGPITVLIVRSGGRYIVLDDTGGTPFATDRRPDFQPMLTFGYGGSWIHGHRIASQTAGLAAAAAH